MVARKTASAPLEVLVVEDEALIRMMVCDALEEAGYRVFEAGDAEQALALLAAVAGPMPVLLTDLNLGPGMDGLALAPEVRRHWPAVAVVYVTGNPDRVLERGLAAHERLIPKPFDPADLIATVREAIRTAGSAAVC